MNIQVLGCSHREADSAFRERLAFPSSEVADFLETFYEQFPESEALLLSTCNRTELYTMGGHPDLLPSRGELLALFSRLKSIAIEELEESLFLHRDESAVKHLFTVSCSLDSMVVGESQIIAQVRDAYEIAIDAKPKTPLIHRTFDAAIRVAKRVSNETKIHENRVSVPSIAVNVLARQIFERLDNKNILVLGAGEMAEETLNHLVAAGASKFTIVNRSFDRAESLAQRFGGVSDHWSSLLKQVEAADLVVSTTGATQPIVTAADFKKVAATREPGTLLILDLAIPRDFDDAICELPGVYLYSLDDLQRERQGSIDSRKSQWPKAQEIVGVETESFFRDVRRRASGSTIALLKKQASAVKDEELERLLNRLESVSEKDRDQIEKAFHRLVNKLLHPPLESIREESTSEAAKPEPVGLLEAMKQLFKLE